MLFFIVILCVYNIFFDDMWKARFSASVKLRPLFRDPQRLEKFHEERRANPIEYEADSDNTSRQFGRWKQVLAMLMCLFDSRWPRNQRETNMFIFSSILPLICLAARIIRWWRKCHGIGMCEIMLTKKVRSILKSILGIKL